MVRQGNVVLMTPSATVDDKKTFMRRMSTALREFDADVARDAEYRNGEGGSSSSSSSDEDEPETPDVRQVRRSKKLLAQELLLLVLVDGRRHERVCLPWTSFVRNVCKARTFSGKRV